MKDNAAATILRWGVSFVFLYAGIDALLEPALWTGYLPHFLSGAASPVHVLAAFAVYEIALAVWLFTGRKLAWSSMFAVVTFAAVVIFNFGVLVVTFRDIGLAFAALALFELARSRREEAGTEEPGERPEDEDELI